MKIVDAEINGVPFQVVERWQERGILHGFGNSALDVSNETAAPTQFLSGKRLLLLSQHHSKIIIQFRSPAADSEWEVLESQQLSGDAWLADFRESGLEQCAFGIKTADCFPVLIAATKLPIVAAVHCGWRGAEAGLLLDTLVLFGRMGISPKSIEMAIGPGAQVADYEIGVDVKEALNRAHSMVDAMSFEPTRPVTEIRDGKIFGNIRELLIAQASFFGLKRNQIALSEISTISNPQYFSHRREPENLGRQLSFISAAGVPAT